ncbi:hypothetical protein Tco_0337030 [Tanacetum coccineum]
MGVRVNFTSQSTTAALSIENGSLFEGESEFEKLKIYLITLVSIRSDWEDLPWLFRSVEYLVNKCDQAPHDSTTGPSSQPEDDTSEKVVHISSSTTDSERTESGTEAAAPKGDKQQGEVASSTVTSGVGIYVHTEDQAGSDPGKAHEALARPDPKPMQEDQTGSDSGKVHVSLAEPNPKHMDEEFLATAYPKKDFWQCDKPDTLFAYAIGESSLQNYMLIMPKLLWERVYSSGSRIYSHTSKAQSKSGKNQRRKVSIPVSDPEKAHEALGGPVPEPMKEGPDLIGLWEKLRVSLAGPQHPEQHGEIKVRRSRIYTYMIQIHQTVTSPPLVIAPFTDISSAKPSSLLKSGKIGSKEMSEVSVKKTGSSADVLEQHTADLIEKYSVLPGPESVKNQESEKSPKEIIKAKRIKGRRTRSSNLLISDDDEDDDDDEGPSAGSNQGRSTKRRRSDSAASGSAQPPPKDDDQKYGRTLTSLTIQHGVNHTTVVLQPIPESERPATPEPEWTIPPNDFPEPENNWANTYATTYKVPEENKLQRKTYDIGSFIKWFCRRTGKKDEKLCKPDFERRWNSISSKQESTDREAVRSKCKFSVSKSENKGKVPTEMELVLELTQQGSSHEVSCRNRVNSYAARITKMIADIEDRHHGPNIGSPRVDGPLVMPEDPYVYVVAAFQAPPSHDYVPGPEPTPPSPIYVPYVPEPVYMEFMPPEDKDLEEDPEEDPADYPADRGDDDDDDDESSDDYEDDDDDCDNHDLSRFVIVICEALLEDFGRLSISDQLEWDLWYAPWLSDQLEWICGEYRDDKKDVRKSG